VLGGREQKVDTSGRSSAISSAIKNQMKRNVLLTWGTVHAVDLDSGGTVAFFAQARPGQSPGGAWQ